MSLEFFDGDSGTGVQLYFHSTVIFTVSMGPVQGRACMLPSSISFFDVLITNEFWIYACVVLEAL